LPQLSGSAAPSTQKAPHGLACGATIAAAPASGQARSGSATQRQSRRVFTAAKTSGLISLPSRAG